MVLTAPSSVIVEQVETIVTMLMGTAYATAAMKGLIVERVSHHMPYGYMERFYNSIKMNLDEVIWMFLQTRYFYGGGRGKYSLSKSQLEFSS